MDPRDQRGTLRIVDASLNRAAEALRVAEDVCRFHWNLPGFAAELKSLRHRIFAIVLNPNQRREDLLRCRDSEGDVGRNAPSPPLQSPDPPALAFRNIERAREAVRSLEETLKLYQPNAVPALEGVRYQLYALEKGLSFLPPSGDLRGRLAHSSIYLLATGSLSSRSLVDVVREAVEAGCDAVQLREKSLPDRQLLALARTLREITARRGALFLINDRPDLAFLARADGVHLGQEDLPVCEAREVLGGEALVGVSTHSVEEAAAAQHQGADYIGAGPIFPTPTKERHVPLLGPRGLRDVLLAVSLPAFAIGGIQADRMDEVLEAGCRRVAVSSWLLAAENVFAAVKALRQKLTEAPPAQQ